jgi:hypothetical protein
LYFQGLADNGNLKFVTNTDRGPNGDPTGARRPFYLPNFQPEIVSFELNRATGEINITNRTGLFRPDGTTPLTGLPNLQAGANGTAYTDEIAVDLNGNVLPNDTLGADLEGIAVAANGDYWMVDEYRPAIYHFDVNGKMLDRFIPQGTATAPNPDAPAGTFGTEALPAVYAQRRSNRGFEAIALEGNKLYAFIQSAIDNPDNAGDTTSRGSRNLRILEFDTVSKAVIGEYIYLLDSISASGNAKTDKLGDAVSLGNGKFGVVERDDLATSASNKLIYQIDLSAATNIYNASFTFPAGKTAIEQLTPAELASAGVNVVTKSLIANAAQYGYTGVEKLEGLALIGSNTLALINDNDFNVSGNTPTQKLGILELTKGLPVAEIDFSIGNYSSVEGNTSMSSATVRINRTGDLSRTSTVELQLSDGTATGDSIPTALSDYNNQSITIIFAAGETFKDVQIPIVGDGKSEGDETIKLSLKNPNAGTLIGINQPKSVLTILNDDFNDAPVGAVSISDTTPTETQTLVASNLFTDADGLTNAVYTYQWQQSDVGGGATFTNIANAIGSTFTPTQAQVNRQLRVVVSYTDDQGTVETLTSVPTIVTGDFFVGTANANTFTGTNGQDIIAGLGNNDILNGLDGDDIFRYTIGDGKDTVDGGAGSDTLDILGTNNSETLSVVFNGTPVSLIAGGTVTNVESVTLDLLGGVDTLNYGSTTADLTVNLATGLATGFTAIANVENVTGGFGNDIITGNDGNNTLRGEFGNDILDGGLGADRLIGGAGDDTYVVDNINDTISDSSGTDTVLSSINWTLGSNLENLILTGFSNINGTGNSLQNVIVGNSGNNILNGGSNADNLTGVAGDDTYIVDNVNDVVNELANEGTDTILSSVTRTLEANVENLTLTGNSTINGTGNDLNNIITGNSRNNIIDGGVGADALIGGLGNDTYIIDNLGDSITETLNQGTDLVKSNVSWTLVDNLENLILTGSANINGAGNSVNNVMTGNDGDNTLSGGFGNDSLTGGLGADILIGGFGNDNLFLGLNDGATDRVVYNLGDDSDVVNQFLRGVGGDLLQFNNIAAIDVRTVGGNTQFRLGDGVTGNGGFANGSLLLTLNGVTGFASGNINDNILAGSIPTAFNFS